MDPTEGAGRAASGREAGRTARRKGNPRSASAASTSATLRPEPGGLPARSAGPAPPRLGQLQALTSPRRPAAALASAGRRPLRQARAVLTAEGGGGGGRQGPRGGVQAGGPSLASPPAPASGWHRPGFEHNPWPVSGATGLGTCRRRGGRKWLSEGLCPQGLEASGDLARPCPAFPALREKIIWNDRGSGKAHRCVSSACSESFLRNKGPQPGRWLLSLGAVQEEPPFSHSPGVEAENPAGCWSEQAGDWEGGTQGLMWVLGSDP